MYKEAMSFLLDTLFPVACLGCGSEGMWFCKNCLTSVRLVARIEREDGAPHLDGIFVACSYDEPIIREAIHLLKYKYVEPVAQSLALILSRALTNINRKRNTDLLEHPQDTILSCVPLHKRRLIERGFNQSDLIARHLAQLIPFQYVRDLLIRHKHTVSQVLLRGRARRENVRNVFACKNFSLSGKNVIIIDDVATTCATLNECAKVLKQNGAQNVYGLVVAHGT